MNLKLVLVAFVSKIFAASTQVKKKSTFPSLSFFSFIFGFFVRYLKLQLAFSYRSQPFYIGKA